MKGKGELGLCVEWVNLWCLLYLYSLILIDYENVMLSGERAGKRERGEERWEV